MKKIVIYIAVVIGICFLIPIFFTVKFKLKEINTVIEVPELSVEKYTYSDFGTIRLLHTKTGEIEEKPLDEYIVEVVSAEMPAHYEMEALKAQSVAARTYTIYKILSGTSHENADLCDSANCCQAWISKEDRLARWDEHKMENWNKIVEAVNATVGEVIAYEGKVINAFFHANSGGMTENVSDVWGGKNLPYLEPVEVLGEDAYPQYLSSVVVSKEEFIQKLKEKYENININFNEESWVEIKEYTTRKKSKAHKIWKPRIISEHKLERFLD
ncbi:MAG: SpoIID/LytB domain-containing protein [Clostridia bacterium]|nr:SpoIID/LytB domain-containing protein [Clostridia bacterium]